MARGEGSGNHQISGSGSGSRHRAGHAAHAGDNKLALTGSAVLTTDYMFRSISNTNQEPAAQAEFDLTYGMFYAYIWGSNTAFGDNIEIDYGVGITPKWRNITFNIAGLYYTYPGANIEIDYFELKTGATWTSGHVDPRRQQLLVAGQFPILRQLRCDRGIGRLHLHGSCGTSSRPASAALSAIQSFERECRTTTPIGTPA